MLKHNFRIEISYQYWVSFFYEIYTRQLCPYYPCFITQVASYNCILYINYFVYFCDHAYILAIWLDWGYFYATCGDFWGLFFYGWFFLVLGLVLGLVLVLVLVLVMLWALLWTIFTISF